MDPQEMFSKNIHTLTQIYITARGEHGIGMLILDCDAEVKDNKMNTIYCPIDKLPPGLENHKEMMLDPKNKNIMFSCLCQGDKSTFVGRNLEPIEQ